jgi:hypothetical protein
MPRKNRYQLIVPSPGGAAPPAPATVLAPPATLTPAQRRIWRRMPGPIDAGSAVVLARLCVHVDRAERIEKALAGLDLIADAKAFARLASLAGAETSRIAALSRGLRLAAPAKGPRDRPPGARPWQK